MRQPDETWDEFEWERGLRESDDFATRYFRLLKRFCDLPGADELIAQHMGPDFTEELPDCDVDCSSCPDRWECDYGNPEDGTPVDQHETPEGEDADQGGPRTPERGDSFFYETDPVFLTVRQAAMGWCNVYAAILAREDRPKGLKALFHIGRALANVAYSIGDGLYEQPPASVAFAKRALGQVNQALGIVNEMMAEHPRSRKVLGALRDHLGKAREDVVDHISRCRVEMEKGVEGDG